jgi:hypothetical protein
VEGDAEFPGIGEKDGDDFARLHACRDQSASEGFDGVSVFGVGEASVAGSVDERDLIRLAPAGREHEIVQENVPQVRVEFGAQHAGSDFTGKRGILKVVVNRPWMRFEGLRIRERL